MSSAASSSTAAATARSRHSRDASPMPDDAFVGFDLHEVPVLAWHAHEPVANRGDVHRFSRVAEAIQVDCVWASTGRAST